MNGWMNERRVDLVSCECLLGFFLRRIRVVGFSTKEEGNEKDKNKRNDQKLASSPVEQHSIFPPPKCPPAFMMCLS